MARRRAARRNVDLDDAALSVLSGWRAPEHRIHDAVGIDNAGEWVFTDCAGDPVHPHSLHQAFRRIVATRASGKTMTRTASLVAPQGSLTRRNATQAPRTRAAGELPLGIGPALGVPAILAVSREPFIVFASNAFAILGLRAMYFLLGDARERFHYLSHALGAILVFVGIKMAVSHWWHMPTAASLAIILAILAAAIVFSVRKRRADALPQPEDLPMG